MMLIGGKKIKTDRVTYLIDPVWVWVCKMNAPRRKTIPGRFATGTIKFPKEIHKEYIEIVLLQMMRDACLDPAIIYAYETTLYWITDNNWMTYTKPQLAAWDKALSDFTNRNR